MFSCRTRGFCPSCHAKRLEEWGEWMRETLLLDVPHRQVVFTIPKMLRIFFKFKRRLLGDLCRCALRALTRYFEVVTGSALTPGVIAVIQTFGDRINLHPHLHFLVTEGGTDATGVFQRIPRLDDSRLTEIFAREVLSFLVGREILSPEWAERILSWRHTGFNKALRGRPDGLPQVWRPNEGRRLHHRACRRGPHRRSSEADVCGGEASAVSGRFPGNPDGRRSPGRLFFMIFPWNGRESSDDFRLFGHRRRLPSCPPALSHRP
jgi:hypothetical protein